MSKKEKRTPLHEGLFTALRAIDNQVARELQRSPEELKSHGVQKWEPLEKRVELVTSLLLDGVADQEISLDGILVLSQSLIKSLQILSSDLGKKGLGQLRSNYLLTAFSLIESDCRRGKEHLEETVELN